MVQILLSANDAEVGKVGLDFLRLGVCGLSVCGLSVCGLSVCGLGVCRLSIGMQAPRQDSVSGSAGAAGTGI